MTFPGFDRFYALFNEYRVGALVVRPMFEVPDGTDLLRGRVKPPSRLTFGLQTGKRAYDLISASDRNMLLISPRALAVLERGQFSGWSTYSVDLSAVDSGSALEGYRGLSVHGRCGPILRDRAQLEIRPTPVAGKNRVAKVGLYFEEGKWDGSDLFMPDTTSFVIVTEVLRDAFAAARLTNVMFERADRFEFAD